MRKEILRPEQIDLLPLIKELSDDFGLVGGTAIALHLGHRQSIDFDLFSLQEFSRANIRNKINRSHKIEEVLRDDPEEYTVLVGGVQLTFFHYPYAIDFFEEPEGCFKIPDLITLAAMKAHALGRRAKWKDYVDLYFILKEHHSLVEIEQQGDKIFGPEFNRKLFRSQLTYFEDIDYSEEVFYRSGFEVDDEEMKRSLVEFSLNQ